MTMAVMLTCHIVYFLELHAELKKYCLLFNILQIFCVGTGLSGPPCICFPSLRWENVCNFENNLRVYRLSDTKLRML